MDSSSYSSTEDEFLLDVMNLLPREPREHVRQNPLVMEDLEFKRKYRFSKEVVEHILHLILPAIAYEGNRNHPIAPMTQLLIALRFYATGSVQNLIAVYMNVSTASICSHKTCDISYCSSKAPIFKDISSTKESFYQIAQFPGVIGCIG